MAARVIGKICKIYYLNGFGNYAPTDKDIERLNMEIASRLPDEVAWCGEDLLVEVEQGETLDEVLERIGEFYVDSIISDAYDALFKYWDEHEEDDDE